MHVLYVLKSESDYKLYIGTTKDLKRRFAEHSAGASRATRSRGPWKIVYYEVYASKRDALVREKKLKQFKNSYTELKKRIAGSLGDA